MKFLHNDSKASRVEVQDILCALACALAPLWHAMGNVFFLFTLLSLKLVLKFLHCENIVRGKIAVCF